MDEFDRSESMWKIDGPISRKEYIWVVLAMLFFAIPIFLLKLLDLATLLFPICIILALIILYLSFVSYAKRFYDIVGNLKTAVIITILIILLSGFFHWLSTIALLICLFVPGKLIKKA